MAKVKNRQDLRLQGGESFANVAQLRISEDAINQLVLRMVIYETTLKTSIPEFAHLDNCPADTQLNLLSMAGAMGPAFAFEGHWPHFRAVCVDQNWDQAAQECHMDDTSNSGLTARNLADNVLVTNAARVTSGCALIS